MNWKNAKGFTLVEMILTVGVMAILVGFTTPAIYQFIRQRDAQNEETAQLQVRKALEAYIADKGSAPADEGSANAPKWYNELAGYTSLSAREIQNDVWDRPRMYVAYNDKTREIYGTQVSVSYVTLHSMGEDGKAQNADTPGGTKVTGLAVASNQFSGANNTGWWRNMSDRPTAFAGVRAAADDKMMRYTNYEDILMRYNTTRERMDKISEALETYARSQYAATVQACSGITVANATCTKDGTPKPAIYYPRSVAREAPKDTALYIKNNASVVEAKAIVKNAGNDKARRPFMENLMLELGLPLEYCCSALDISLVDNKPVPFYYFSNPRARTGATTCGTRPTTGVKLPARITVKYIDSGTTNATCG